MSPKADFNNQKLFFRAISGRLELDIVADVLYFLHNTNSVGDGYPETRIYALSINEVQQEQRKHE